MKEELRCHDCSMEVAPTGEWEDSDGEIQEYPIEGEWEYGYMVHDEVWKAANGPPDNYPKGMLCIGCLEARLGRTLTWRDFKLVPISEPSEVDTPRLADRKRRL